MISIQRERRVRVARGAWKRIVLGIFLPAPISCLLIELLIIGSYLFKGGLDLVSKVYLDGDNFFFLSLLFTSLFAYVFVGIQSVFYSFLMEFIGIRVAKKYKNPYVYLLIGAILGAVSGWSLFWPGKFEFIFIGVITGFAASVVLGLFGAFQLIKKDTLN